MLTIVLIGSNLVALKPNVSAQPNTSACILYDAHQKLIHIRCKSTHLSDIYQKLDNPSVLHIENSTATKTGTQNGKVWILNAGIVIEKDGRLIIDSTDTSWLKMVPTPTMQEGKQLASLVVENGSDTDDDDIPAKEIPYSEGKITKNSSNIINGNKEEQAILVSKNNGDNPNGIHVHGSLNIDSVKITSWNPEKKDVISFDFGKRAGEENTKSDYDTAEPRAFIRVSKDATGTSNITNSELAYLGYSCSRCSGLSYYGGEGSVIKGNDIHHLLKGFYSNNMGEMVIEENKFHDNYLYGIDPHTGTHDIIIRNNKVHDNNASAIICSKHCYNILIERNELYNNEARSIAFSINTTHSTARNNYVHNESTCIGSNRGSNFNRIYNNTFTDCRIGVDFADTSNNLLNHNIIKNVYNGIVTSNITNKIENNSITNASNGIVFIVNPSSKYGTDTSHNYNKIDGISYENTLLNIQKNNSFSNIANLTSIEVLPITNTTMIDKGQENKTTIVQNSWE